MYALVEMFNCIRDTTVSDMGTDDLADVTCACYLPLLELKFSVLNCQFSKKICMHCGYPVAVLIACSTAFYPYPYSDISISSLIIAPALTLILPHLTN